MKPPAEPHPTCTVCGDDACAFHAAENAEELAAALNKALRTRGALGLLESLEASIATLTAWEENPLSPLVAKLPVKPLQTAFMRILDKDTFNGDDLVRLAATALALRVLTDAKEQHG